MRFVSCASYYGTGSSAITDLLEEYSDVYSFSSEEFRFLHDPDGIDDLAYHVVENQNRHNSGHAVKRFKKLVDFQAGGWYGKKYSIFFGDNWKKYSYEYIDELTNFQFHGSWDYDLYDRGMFYYFRKRIVNKLLHMTIWRNKPELMYNSMKNEITYGAFRTEEEFVDITKRYIRKLFGSVCPEDKIIMVDQIVPPTSLWRYTRYFDDIKVVIVDRDPRDVWTLEKYFWKDGIIPYDDVETYCKWFKATRAHRITEKMDEATTMFVQFEDLIFHYEETTSKISDWLRLSEDKHVRRKEGFNPERSIKNTKCWLNIPETKDEIEYIERELAEYLYDFPNN